MSFDTTAELQNTKPMLGFKTGSSVPTVSFGGQSVGISYSTQTCNWTVIGDRIFFDLRVVLSSKGSSVGALLIATNVPAAYVSQGGAPISIWINGVAPGVGSTAVYARVFSGDRAIQVGEQNISTGGFSDYTDASVTSTFELRASGSWRIA